MGNGGPGVRRVCVAARWWFAPALTDLQQYAGTPGRAIVLRWRTIYFYPTRRKRQQIDAEAAESTAGNAENRSPGRAASPRAPLLSIHDPKKEAL